MNNEIYICWGVAYAVAVNGWFDLKGSYHTFSNVQRQRQLERLDEWWAA